jgi:DNA-binding NarL/FixJ family response regulator
LEKKVPDLILLDIGLPDGDGVAYCAEITKKYPDVKVIMLTSYKEFNVAKRAIQNGALGYILKNAEPEEIFAGIETVHQGDLFLCEEIDILLKDKKDVKAPWYSPREIEVLQYIADGRTTREIAKRIFRDDETVKTHRRNLLIKLDAINTAVMIKKACEQNLVRINV